MQNTFYHGDCLFVMNHDIEPNSVDLIYLDPPFFTGKVQKGTAKWNPAAMEVSYEDSKKFWGEAEKVKAMRDRAPEWMRHIALERPDFASYLFYMMERLQACHRTMKDTGNIYLHCDYRASHYLKMIMDEVFGYNNFRNEIIWHFGLGGFNGSKIFPIKCHSILLYGKNAKRCYHIKLRGESSKAMDAKYCHHDIDGDFMLSYGKKYYKKGGKPFDCVWDIPSLSPTDKERIGYPSQKPVELLGRIIEASCPDNGVVLDPFCGCGTTIVAAQKSNRGWIGIDISSFAHDHIINRKDVQESFFAQALHNAKYVSRDIDEIKLLTPKKKDGVDGFEEWVNEYHKASKPIPDGGVDGITTEGIPIQSKAYEIRYPQVSEFATNIKHHPKVPQPVKRGIMVSQIGFDQSARKRQFEIETSEGITIELRTPTELLGVS